MKKTLSLKKNSDFQYIFNKGEWHDSKMLSIHIIPNKKDINSLGIAIGKKVAKSVKRHRIRRLIKEAYRLNEDKFKAGYNIIIVWKTKANIEDATFNNIQENLIKCFEKAGLM